MNIPLNLISMEADGFHLMLHAVIGGVKANVLIDTGASRTVMDLSRARKYIGDLSIKPFHKSFTGMGAGAIETYFATIPEIQIGGNSLKEMEVVLIDLSPLNKSYALEDLPRIDMVMGGDWLIKLDAVIDYPNKTLKIGRI